MSYALTENRSSLRSYDAIQAERQIAELAEAGREAARMKARAAVDGIKAIPGWAFDEATCAHLISVLSEKVSGSNWIHTSAGETASAVLDDLHDDLTYGASK